jgi:AcrR family transcriptional regulator
MSTLGQGTKRRILLAAARVLAARQAASMADIAAAAEITRGTLYRHFPARESLIQALEAAANEEAGRRLAEANLDQVPVEEGLARATRALSLSVRTSSSCCASGALPSLASPPRSKRSSSEGARAARSAPTSPSRPSLNRCSSSSGHASGQGRPPEWE